VLTTQEVLVLTVLDAPDRLALRTRFWCDPVDGATITSDVVEKLAEALRSRGHAVVATSAVPEPPLTPPPAL